MPKSSFLRTMIRLLPFLATLVICFVGILLGNWQSRRAEQKEEMARQIATESHQAAQIVTRENLMTLKAFQRVRLRGYFVHQWPLYLDNRPLAGKAGMYALMPFQLSDADNMVLVERGWFPRDPMERTKIPALDVPTGEIEIEGVVREHIDRSMQLGHAETIAPGAIIQNISVSALSAQLKNKMPDWVVEQTSSQGGGLQRDWPQPSSGSDKHRAYAFQWYGLAAMAALFFVVTGIRRGKKHQ